MKIKFVLVLTVTVCVSVQAQVLPNDAIVGGKPLSEWTAEWFIWTWLWPTNTQPSLDPDGRWATNGQSPNGPVFFLTGVFGGLGLSTKSVRAFSIPEDRYLFFPLAAVEGENIDTVPPFSVEQLRDFLAADIATVSELHASIDGVSVPDLFQHHLLSPAYSYILPDANNLKTVLYGHPITGLIDPEVADGYWLMVAPLSPGIHVLKWGGTIDLFDYVQDTTATITVVPIPLSKRVEQLIAVVQESKLPSNRLQPLLASLDASKASFTSTNLAAGIKQLGAFQNKVRAQVARTNPSLAEQLEQAAQLIIHKATAELSQSTKGNNQYREALYE